MLLGFCTCSWDKGQGLQSGSLQAGTCVLFGPYSTLTFSISSQHLRVGRCLIKFQISDFKTVWWAWDNLALVLLSAHSLHLPYLPDPCRHLSVWLLTHRIRSEGTLETIQQWQLTCTEPPVHAGVVLRAVCAPSHLNFTTRVLNTHLQENRAGVICFFFFNWSIVGLQYCISFRCTVKWFSYLYYICIYIIYFCSFSGSFPL